MSIETIFVDLGGVLLTNGWDREARKKAVEVFSLDGDEFEARHKEVVEDLENGVLTLEGYLRHVVFQTSRNFTTHDFQEFMFDCSKPHKEMIELLKNVKATLKCKVAALSNEGKELGSYRIEKCHLKEVIDYFIVSGFVGYAKPDERIFKLALNLSQTRPNHAIYIDDREVLIEAGKRMGLHTILHHSSAETRSELEALAGCKFSAD
jgi:putative hydrolase of the HAD superfamily